jgi:hypothetical protein
MRKNSQKWFFRLLDLLESNKSDAHRLGLCWDCDGIVLGLCWGGAGVALGCRNAAIGLDYCDIPWPARQQLATDLQSEVIPCPLPFLLQVNLSDSQVHNG